MKFDQQFDDGESVLEMLDLSQAKRVMQKQTSIKIDFPIWMVESLDKEAERLALHH